MCKPDDRRLRWDARPYQSLPGRIASGGKDEIANECEGGGRDVVWDSMASIQQAVVAEAALVTQVSIGFKGKQIQGRIPQRPNCLLLLH